MGARRTEGRSDVRLRATVSGTGDPGPIEARLGRRLLELVAPNSDKGRALLAEGLVEIIGPEGESLGRIGLEEARERLRRRAEAALEAATAQDVREAVSAGRRPPAAASTRPRSSEPS